MEKNKYALVIPEGWTKEEYYKALEETPQEEEYTSFWDKKIKVDPVTGIIIEIFSELFFGFIKCFLFFLEEYPKALEEVRREEAAKREKRLTSLPRQRVIN